jgi:hypothetical protein
MKMEKADDKFLKTVRLIAVSLLGLVGLLIAVFFVQIYQDKCSDNATVFTVNNEPVSKAEFLNEMSGLKSTVFSAFAQKYSVKDNIEFWTTSYDNETPIVVLKEKTMSSLKRMKIEQILFKKNGIAADISYSRFLKDLETENQRRKEALAKNEVIYGPKIYDKVEYYNVLHDNRVEELKNKLSSNQLSVKDSEITSYYNRNRGNLYKKPDDIKYQKIEFKYSDATKSDAESKIAEMLSAVKSGKSFQNVVNSFKKQSKSDITYTEQTYNENAEGASYMMHQQLVTKLNEIASGQTSDIIDDNNCLSIIKVLEKSSSGYYTLADVKDNIKSELIKEKYDLLISKMESSAKVVVDSKIYEEIS